MKTSITYKRVLSLVATLLLVALPAMAFAAPELTATADKTSVTAGDTVVVTVTLAGKKLSAAEGEFSYDPSLLTFTEGDGGASDGRIALVSAEKDGASSLSARITFTAADAGEAKVDFNITKALNYSGEDQGAATASVTVSIAAETIGIFKVNSRVILVRRSVSRGRMVECAGTSNTSSKVRAFCLMRMLTSVEKCGKNSASP